MFISVITQILASIGGVTVLIAISAWCARTLTVHWLAKDLEAHKVRLKEDSDRELESARANLKRAAFEYETRFGRLHEEIVRAILEVYPPLHELYQAVLSYLSPTEFSTEPTKEDKLKIVAEKSKALNTAYVKNRILFPKNLYKQLDDFFTELSTSTNNFTFGLQRDKSGGTMLPGRDPWTEAMQAVQAKLKPLFDAMHDELQAVLGFQYIPQKQGLEPPSPIPPQPSPPKISDVG
jgi:hypothetical protein